MAASILRRVVSRHGVASHYHTSNGDVHDGDGHGDHDGDGRDDRGDDGRDGHGDDGRGGHGDDGRDDHDDGGRDDHGDGGHDVRDGDVLPLFQDFQKHTEGRLLKKQLTK
ncbi:hypothetical protein AVEN_240092-1 [Araneus ventricosus]|uniref:Uncharacterized protein n=1 Tax=Araneus ventricosus TaxID=182803 RepID=A0A4Y2RKC7_ARAVE|nr:hypothetical protein AVEN_121069-1 [Araneus ventricosus]GBN76461.1 hypothetical protein AVEN_240092-1 [Araneus ventricosus]